MSYNPQLPQGQAASADSSPVVLSTEQEAILQSIDTNTGGLSGFATEATLLDLDNKFTLGANSVAGSPTINIAIDQPPIETLSSQVESGANITANGENCEVLANASPLTLISITGTWSGTLDFLATPDGGITYDTVFAEYQPNAGIPLFSTTLTATSNGTFVVHSTGYTHVRVQGSSWVSGTAVIRMNASHSTGLNSTNWLLDSIRGGTASIAGYVDAPTSTLATETTLSGIKSTTDQMTFSGGDLNVNLASGDIEIGAVEIKDGTTDTRVTVQSDGVDNAMVVMQNSQPLPTGAATSALQSTINTTLGSPFQAGGSIGNTAFGVNNGAGASAVNIQDGGNSITVDGPLTDTQLRATPVPISGSTTVSGTIAATQSGTWNINNVSGTVSLPTGAATAALQTQPGVDIGDVTVNNASGASAVNIQDGGNSITVDATSLPLPTGAATSANQATEIASLASIDAGIPAALGQATMANSMPVVIPSDQTDLPTRATSTTTSSLTAGSLNADLVASTDVSNYKSFSIQITGTWTGTLTFQGSNDNSTFITLIAKNAATNTGVGVGTATANGVFYGNFQFKYLRVRMTAYTSGTANGTLILNTQPMLPVVGGVTTQAVSATQLPAALGQTTMSASMSVAIASDQSNVPVALQATTTAGGISSATTTAYATSLVVKASAGALYAMTGYNSSNQTRFIQVHNTTSQPADTSVPLIMFSVAPATSFAWSADGLGRAFSTGITIVSSTTGPTLTASTATMWVDAQYK